MRITFFRESFSKRLAKKGGCVILKSFIVVMFLLANTTAHAQFDLMLKGLGVGQDRRLSETKIISGLKEALRIGTENTVNLTGRIDGYFLNEAIKILMPEKLRRWSNSTC